METIMASIEQQLKDAKKQRLKELVAQYELLDAIQFMIIRLKTYNHFRCRYIHENKGDEWKELMRRCAIDQRDEAKVLRNQIESMYDCKVKFYRNSSLYYTGAIVSAKQFTKCFSVETKKDLPGFEC